MNLSNNYSASVKYEEKQQTKCHCVKILQTRFNCVHYTILHHITHASLAIYHCTIL